MAILFEAYVTNAGKYSEGQLVGETLKFPTTDVYKRQNQLNRIKLMLSTAYKNL